jgi:hypothetical protein
VTVEAGTLEFLVQSPRLTAITNNRRYMVDLTLYWDDAHTHAFATHRQEVLFSMPQEELWRIEKAYGIHIL